MDEGRPKNKVVKRVQVRSSLNVQGLNPNPLTALAARLRICCTRGDPEVRGQPHAHQEILDTWEEGCEPWRFSQSFGEGCPTCKISLQLCDTVKETRQGLGSILHIKCRDCCSTTPVPTDSRHKGQGESTTAEKVWDVNTKAALGMLYAGLGSTSINKFFSVLNLPRLRHEMLKTREREVGPEVEKLAKESCHDAAQKELSLSTCALPDSTKSVAVSFDGGWQKRGSGHSYDSLSGHASMIGKETGEILSYDVRCKDCRYCRSSSEHGGETYHDCRKNWAGSAKAMEADMCVSMLKNLKGEGIEVKTLIMDNDSTSIARARNEVDASIIKAHDTNHLKKSFSSKLYEMAKRHKQLNSTLIAYITRCFMYALKQNSDNSEEISKNLRSIAPHLFGDHKMCSEVWCGFKQNPDTYVPKHLPYRRYLTDNNLKVDLTKLIENYAEQGKCLTSLGSSQRNEAFNRSVLSKNPKSHHYSASESTCFRVAAAVAQNNKGNSFAAEVNSRLDLSPGSFTVKHGEIEDKEKKRKSDNQRTTDFKRRRLNRKAKAKKDVAVKEIREGVTYQSNVTMETQEKDYIEEIPPPILAPTCQPLPPREYEEIFFDLETTGLGQSHIVQLAAFRADGDSFSRYVLPKQPMTLDATRITGIAVQHGKIFLHGQAVPSCTLQTCLDEFSAWLSKCEKPVLLIAHNAIFDATIFINGCINTNNCDTIRAKVAGFLDTLKVTRHVYPGRKNYKQSSLVSDILKASYTAHDAVEDCKALCDLYQHTKTEHNVSTDHILQFSFTVQYVREKVIYDKQSKLNISSLQSMIDSSVITKLMAGKIAGSGLSMRSLQLAYSRDSQSGIRNLFQEKVGAKCRVTNNNRIAQNCTKYFSNRQSGNNAG